MSHFKNFSELQDFEPVPGMKSKLLHTETQSLALWKIEEGVVLGAHAHPQEQISFVTKGELELTIGSEVQVLKPGMVAVIPSNVLHSAVALTYCELTDVFNPARDDLRNAY